MNVVSVEKLAHSFGDQKVLKEINLEVKKGEIFGLLGPSGSGKTTLVKMIVGVWQPKQGDVFVSDVKMPSLLQLKKIGYMAQSDALYSELTARENLDFFASIYNLPKTKRKERVEQVLTLVDLSNDKDKPVQKFSGGMKRRLSLAAALLHEPDLLILDEPTVGIDPVLRQSIWEELGRLKEDGVTIIVTTHVMDEAEKCDRLAMLRDGYVIASDEPKKLKESTQSQTLEEAFLVYGGGN